MSTGGMSYVIKWVDDGFRVSSVERNMWRDYGSGVEFSGYGECVDALAAARRRESARYSLVRLRMFQRFPGVKDTWVVGE